MNSRAVSITNLGNSVKVLLQELCSHWMYHSFNFWPTGTVSSLSMSYHKILQKGSGLNLSPLINFRKTHYAPLLGVKFIQSFNDEKAKGKKS